MKSAFEVNANFTEHSFWESINILIKKPHVVNKRLWGCKILNNMKYETNFLTLHSALQTLKVDKTCNIDQFFKKLPSPEIENGYPGTIFELIAIELLPKNYEENHAYQLVVLDMKNIAVTFYNITCDELKQNICPNFTYSFTFRIDKLVLETFSGNAKSISWLKESVLPQIKKWAEETGCEVSQQICKESLIFIDSDKYYIKYNELKTKYGKELVKIWPECTDPSKFVYEDIAIATYLLLLWGDQLPHSFVDVGCGNGLLVYILTMEGHEGIGVDVRKRKIWDMYPKNVRLEEKTITPSNINSFNKYEWIIGNHSDELTPWIPVIASLGSYNSKFFLLPCCAYNFDGSKYRRHDSSKSQYTEYLEYIKSLCVEFGFEVNVDRLKIPSTKRICLVGNERIYSQEEYQQYCLTIQEYVNTALRINKVDSSDFKTREKVEKVRNCTKIDKIVIESIVKCVTSALMDGCKFDSAWCSGKEVEISDLIKLIPENMLKMLKSECGGLQTLLRNNYHIFKVVNGKVQFRYPKSIEEVHQSMTGKKKNIKSIRLQVKRCWFYDNHPQRCPLSNDTCSFLHVNL